MNNAQAVTATFAAIFTNTPLVVGTTSVRAAHLVELRTAIDTLRMWRGSPAMTWTDPSVVAGVTVVRAVHLIELRSALDGVFTADGLTPPTWSAPPVAGTTLITAAQIEEVRTHIRTVE